MQESTNKIEKYRSISVIIPIAPEGTATAALNSIALSDYPEEVEIILVEGTQPAEQRNIAVRKASGKILYFMDSDALVAKDTLKRIAENFQDKKLSAVGGPNLTPEDSTFLEKCFGWVLESRWGTWNMRSRYTPTGKRREAGESELTFCNLALNGEVINGSKLLNPDLFPNEENELLSRIRASKKRVVYDPLLVNYHRRRGSFKGFACQIFGYGTGRAYQTRIVKSIPIQNIMPTLFLLYVLYLPFSASLEYALPLVVHTALSMINSAWYSITKKNLRIMLAMVPAYFLVHIAYGAGMLYGALRGVSGFKNPRIVKRQKRFKLRVINTKTLQYADKNESKGLS